MKVVKSIPASENGPGVRMKTRSGAEYIVSMNRDKRKFTLWRCTDAGYEKMSVANAPTDLYQLVDLES